MWPQHSKADMACGKRGRKRFLYFNSNSKQMRLTCSALNCSFSSSRVWPICEIIPSGLEKWPHQVANKLNSLPFKSRDNSVAQDSTVNGRSKVRYGAASYVNRIKFTYMKSF